MYNIFNIHILSGFGNALAKRLDRLGFVVIAGCLDVNGDGAEALRNWSDTDRIHVVPLDVTNDEQIQKAVEYAQEHCPEGTLMILSFWTGRPGQTM